MTTKAIESRYTLNESEALGILKSKRRIIKESSVPTDLKLSREERVKYASSILKSRR